MMSVRTEAQDVIAGPPNVNVRAGTAAKLAIGASSTVASRRRRRLGGDAPPTLVAAMTAPTTPGPRPELRLPRRRQAGVEIGGELGAELRIARVLVHVALRGPKAERHGHGRDVPGDAASSSPTARRSSPRRS